MKKLLFGVMLLLMSAPIRTTAGQKFISAGGNNTQSGDKDAPWENLAYAITKVSPGDTIYVRGGTYPESEIWIRSDYGMGGLPGHYLTIAAYPGESPRFTNNSRSLIIDASYVRVQGLHFEDGKSIYNVNWAARSNHVEIIGNKFTGMAGYAAIQLMGDDNLVENNVIELDGNAVGTQGHGIYVQEGVNNIIRGNTVSGMTGYGIHLYEEHRSEDPPGYNRQIVNATIEQNIIFASQARSGIIVGAGADSGPATIHGVVVRNNVLYNNAECGLVVNGWSKIRDVRIYNNTMTNNGAPAIYLGGDTDSVIISNNIFCYPQSNPHVKVESSVPTVTVLNNLYFPSPRKLEGATDSNGIEADPLFIDAANNDYHLRRDSPAIDRGLDLGLPYLGSAPDLGAFEFADPLAIDLQGFQAEQVETGILLSWQITADATLYLIQLEKSLDGTHFESVHTVYPEKNDGSRQSFSYLDTSLFDSQIYYRLQIMQNSGAKRYSQVIRVDSSLPGEFILNNNTPNPFQEGTMLEYALAGNTQVRLEIFDVNGRHIRTLLESRQQPGRYTIRWDGRDNAGAKMASGVYFYRLATPATQSVRKMILVH